MTRPFSTISLTSIDQLVVVKLLHSLSNPILGTAFVCFCAVLSWREYAGDFAFSRWFLIAITLTGLPILLSHVIHCSLFSPRSTRTVLGCGRHSSERLPRLTDQQRASIGLLLLSYTSLLIGACFPRTIGPFFFVPALAAMAMTLLACCKKVEYRARNGVEALMWFPGLVVITVVCNAPKVLVESLFGLYEGIVPDTFHVL
jgi:hypothetical protein